MVDMAEARQRPQRFANGRLLANDQRHRAEVGKGAAFGEKQAEFLDTGGLGGSLQQPADGCDRYPHIRTFEALPAAA